MDDRTASPSLEEEIRQVARKGRRASQEAAFRAAVEERLRSLESQTGEIKSRLNGLLFFVASTVITQVVLRLFE